MGSGGTVQQACRKLGISEATRYNWRKQYGRIKLDQIKTLQKDPPRPGDARRPSIFNRPCAMPD
ncbi:transposase [Anaerohalosphaera lusitana]|uniref:transposase n=1 Tax=Anaerohalosphaera lusitana TaxID=1936003 RepID=UPI003AAAF813